MEYPVAGTVLMVEPNPGILVVARNVLARAGFELVGVPNVPEGLKLARRVWFHAVLLDAKHADSDALRAFSSCRTPPIPIVLTVQKGRDSQKGSQPPEGQAGGLAGQAADVAEVVYKPFQPEELLATVERVVDRSDAGPDRLVRVDSELESLDGEATERFPFAELLQDLGSADGETKGMRSMGTRAVRLVRLLQAAFDQEGAPLSGRQVVAAVTACEVALDSEARLEDVDVSGEHLAVSGDLRLVSIDQVLQFGTSLGAETRCLLENGPSSVELYLRGPFVVFARQTNLPEGFTLGRLLVGAGLVEHLAIEQSVDPRAGLQGWLGQRLLKLGYISEQDLHDALTRQAEELVYEAVCWRAGRFHLYVNTTLPEEGRSAGVALPVHHLLLEGMRRLDEWQRMTGVLGDLRSIVQRVHNGDEDGALDLLRPEERRILEHVVGEPTLAEIVRTVCLPTYEVLRAVHQLADHRLVQVRAGAA